MQILYDISSDTLSQAPRLISAIGGVIMACLFLLLLVDLKGDLSDKKERRHFSGYFCVIFLLFLFSLLGFSMEWKDYNKNYFVEEYTVGNYDVSQGEVKFDEEQYEGSLTFSVGNTDFEIKSDSFVNRGYRVGNYNGSFDNGDVIKVFYVENPGTLTDQYIASAYPDKVIVRIEKSIDERGE
ncbi:MAG: hypothetical protein ACI4XE_10385 [Acutalibacteraceae bacterium]